MNAFQNCQNTADAVPLYLPQQLYLKPIARMNISVQLPQRSVMGKTISNWELMEKLRFLIKPDEFTVLKVTKTTIEFIRFEAEVEDKNKLEKVIFKLENKMIRLKEFDELLRVRAAVYKSTFPTRHTWDTFFRESKDMNEMKPGERPDTVHLSHLPIRWFVPYHLSGEEDIKPSEKIFYKVFEKFGNIRYVDIPICDPYRNKMKAHMSGMQIFTFDEHEFFEGYVQFKDYIGFMKAMSALRDMKLLLKGDDQNLTVNIKVDFDKTKHLSDASIKRREIVRERLVMKQREQEAKEKQKVEEQIEKQQAERQKEVSLKAEKERRRREREEKRRAKILEKLKIKGTEEINEKIAKEERKLLRVQRKLESIRIVEALFKRIKEKKENDFNGSVTCTKNTSELAKLKSSSEIELNTQKEKLYKAIEERVMLKSILPVSESARNNSDTSSDTSLDSNTIEVENTEKKKYPSKYRNVLPNWYYNYPFPNRDYPPHVNTFCPLSRSQGADHFHFPFRGRGASRDVAGTSRGCFQRRGRGYNQHYRGRYRGRNMFRYSTELAEEYYKYFYKFLREDDCGTEEQYRSKRTKSRSKSYSRKSYSRHSSSSSNSYRGSRSCSKSHKSSRHRSLSRPYSKERSRSKYSEARKSRSRDRAKFRKKRCNRSSSESTRKRSSRSADKDSVDSSLFISPSRSRRRQKSMSSENGKARSKSASPNTK